MAYKKLFTTYELEHRKYMGRKIKTRRLQLKKTQTKIATLVGVTFQQVQKYEKGTNGLSGSMVKRMGYALQIPRCKIGYLVYKYNYGFKSKTKRN
mgnify:CR=1 FL=1